MLARVIPVVALVGCADPEADVTIIRGEDGVAWLDLTVRGVALDVPDGTAVVIQVGMPDRPPERLGLGVTEVDDGGFDVRFPDVWESALYKRKIVLLDRDGDRGCGDGDTVLVDYSAALVDTTITTEDMGPTDCTEFVADWPTR